MKKIFLFVMLCLATAVNAVEFKLVDSKKPVCSIVLSKTAGPVEKHAANELAKYLAGISGGDAPEILPEAAPGTYPIRFMLTPDDKELAVEGFRLKADSAGVVICARRPLGFLYGVYEILKRYGGIRWLFPGTDGEYFTPKATIAVSGQDTVYNPAFGFRSLHACYAATTSPKWDTFDWMVRNNMRIVDHSHILDDSRLKPGLLERGATTLNGGHCFTRLLDGTWLDRSYKDAGTYLKQLYREHPEYFPLINGKRTFLEGQKYQPCTSNPEVIKTMSDRAVRWIKEKGWPDGIWEMSNNDGTGWCQCENCRKLDSDYDRKNGYLTTRYWTIINQIAAACYQASPDAEIWGIAYQNFQAPPVGIMPDKRLTVMLAFNRRCFRHRIEDPDCITNRQYLPWFKGWFKIGNRYTTWEQIDSAAGYVFMPIEDVFIDTLKFYAKNGVDGCWIEVPPPDGKYTQSISHNTMIQNGWRAIWQTLYCGAALMWNMNQDYAALYEEANTLFYGKGWAGGMREFRQLLIKTASETPGCFGHGHSAPLGRCLDKPGVQEKLLALLEAAQKAAASDPDPRALKHVKEDSEFFRKTWLKFREDYLANYRDIRVYQRTAPIKIDGVVDEKDWESADIVSNFKLCNGKGAPEAQTYVRTVYDPENIYFAIEAMEPHPDKMVTAVTRHDGDVWEDNTLEIFISHPDMGNRYYQFVANANGVLCDMLRTPGAPIDRSFQSGAELKTRILPDRWVLEIRIPSAPLGEKCQEGQSWKVNIARGRLLTTMKFHENENSSWSYGYPHDVGRFHSVAFCRAREVTTWSRQEIDTRGWKNGGLNEVGKPRFAPAGWILENGLAPKDWILPGQGELAMKEENFGDGNYFLRLKKGRILQVFEPVCKGIKVNFRVRGTGSVSVYAYRYTRPDPPGTPRKNIKSELIGTLKMDSQEWRYEKLSYSKPDENETVGVAFHLNNGELDFDDIFVSADEGQDKQ